VLKQAPRHEGVLREWKYSSMHSLTSALDGGEWSASRPGRFISRERAPGIHLIRGWVYIGSHRKCAGMSVSIVTGYGLDNRGSVAGKQGNVFFATTFRSALVPTQTPIQYVFEFFPGVKMPELEADHLSPFNAWSLTSVVLCAFLALFRHRTI
jgi:hypothetical protein